MKAWELFKALEEGKLLERDCIFFRDKDADKQYFNEEEDLLIMYFFKNDADGCEAKGWASAIWSSSERVLLDISDNPERWRVSKYMVHDYPWSFAFEEKMKALKEETFKK